MIDLTTIVDGTILQKTFKVREDEDQPKSMSKTIHLKVKFVGTLQGVFHKAMSPVVIAVQGKVRKHWSQYKDGQTVEVSFATPTVAEVDPIDRIMALAEAAGLSVEEFLTREVAKRTAPELEPVK